MIKGNVYVSESYKVFVKDLDLITKEEMKAINAFNSLFEAERKENLKDLAK